MAMFAYSNSVKLICFHDALVPSLFSGDLKKAAPQDLLVFTVNTNNGDKANSSSEETRSANSLLRDTDESLSETG